MCVLSNLPVLAQAPDEIIVTPPPGVKSTTTLSVKKQPVSIKRPIILPIKLPQQLFDYFLANEVRGETASSFEAFSIDLNSDGKPEIIISAKTGVYCGASDCEYWVYRRVGNRYEKIIDEAIGSLEAQNVFTKGYRNVAAVSGGAAEASITLYKFDGQHYQQSACFTRDYTGKRPVTKRVACAQD